MAIWLPYKAKAHELKNRQQKTKPQIQRTHYCVICNMPIYSGKYCDSCNKYIIMMQRKENGKNGT